MATQAVLFDAVGTLIFAKPPVAQVYYQAGRRCGSQLDEREVGARLQHFIPLRLYQNELGHRSHETSQRDMVRRWQQIVGDVFDDLHDTTSLFEHLWRHFSEGSNWALFSDVSPTLRELRDAGIKVGVASNFDDRLDRIVRQLRLVNDPCHVFHSARLGVQKPAREFFDKIQAQLALQPDQLVMVGDDWRDDFRAPRRAGWKSYWLTREDSTASENKLTSLQQLLDVIV